MSFMCILCAYFYAYLCAYFYAKNTHNKEENIMATLNGIIECLKDMKPEFEITQHEVVKNLVKLQGITIREPNSKIAPCIYIDNLLSDDISDFDAARQILAIYNKSGLDIDISCLLDKEYILSHIYLGLQRKDDNCDYLTRNSDYDDIIEYMYIRGNVDSDHFSVKVTTGILEDVGIDPSEAWNSAQKATENEISISSLSEAINWSIEENTENYDYVPMWVVSNSLKLNGAATIKNKEFIRKWAKEHGYEKLIIIFSSIHECILLPAKEFELDYITDMINSVNDECVSPVEQLANKAYIFDV